MIHLFFRFWLTSCSLASLLPLFHLLALYKGLCEFTHRPHSSARMWDGSNSRLCAEALPGERCPVRWLIRPRLFCMIAERTPPPSMFSTTAEVNVTLCLASVLWSTTSLSTTCEGICSESETTRETEKPMNVRTCMKSEPNLWVLCYLLFLLYHLYTTGNNPQASSGGLCVSREMNSWHTMETQRDDVG